MITKERLKVMAAILLGLAIVYFFTKTIGALMLAAICIGGGWFLKGKYGDWVKERVDQITIDKIKQNGHI